MGGNRRLSENDDRSFDEMFDGNSQTYWHGYMPATQKNSVLVSFKLPIMFKKLVFTARPDKIHKQERYRRVCLYLNTIEAACTSKTRFTKPGDKIVLGLSEVKKVETVELRFQVIAAEVAELEIYYVESGC